MSVNHVTGTHTRTHARTHAHTHLHTHAAYISIHTRARFVYMITHHTTPHHTTPSDGMVMLLVVFAPSFLRVG